MVRQALATWQAEMRRATGLAATSRAEYARDGEHFVAWLEHSGFSGTGADVTAQDIRDYRDYLLDLGRAPTTVNRALVSVSLLLHAAGRTADNCERYPKSRPEVGVAPGE